MPQVDRRLARSWVLGVIGLALSAALGAWPQPTAAAQSSRAFGGPIDALSASPQPVAQAEVEQGEVEQAVVIPGHYIVVLEDFVAHPAAVAEAQTEQRGRELELVYRHALKGYSAELTKGAVDALRANPKVKFVSPNHAVEAFAQTTPAGVKRTFALSNPTLDIDEADDVRVDADVAIIDTGIYEHTDLNIAGKTDCVPPGENLEGEASHEECQDGSGFDSRGHGTHVAGTVGALDNEEGVVGVAPGVRLWAARVLNRNGSGAESWIIAAVDWVTEHSDQIEVANMSLGCECSMPALEEGIKTSAEAGVVYTVSAGNSAKDAKYFSPAKQPDVITVSALADSDGKPGGEGPKCLGKDDTLASFSNFGAGVEIAAPGTCIYSTMPDGEYATLNGTSMASPHVAGAAAILASENDPENLEDVYAIREAIVEAGNLDSKAEGGWDDISGDGIQEPLLDIDDEGVFSAKALPALTKPASVESETKATLRGLVNPGGVETDYHFEYGTTSSYGTKVPLPSKSIGSGSAYVAVQETLENLKGQTLYHYRVVASQPGDTHYGKDQVFGTTLPAVAIESPTVHANNATLKANIDPEGLSTTYQFEYGTTNSYGQRFPTLPKSIGSGTDDVAVEEPIGFLTTDKEYHYRLRVSSPAGVSYSEDQTFTTGSSQWNIEETPVESNIPHYLVDVSCSSQDDCMAVGYRSVIPPGSLLAEHWNGEEWAVVPVPDPAEEESVATLESVSCTSEIWCVATGWFQEDGKVQPVVERWNGAKWVVMEFPEVEAETTKLIDVSCVSSTSCVGVGWKVSYGKGILPQLLAASWNGKTWTLQSPPEPTGTGYSFLSSVSCASRTFCVAVGGYTSISEQFHPLIEHWDGDAWSIALDIEPVENSFYSFEQVSCGAPDSCLTPVLGGEEAERWDGEEWTPEPVPVAVGTGPGSFLTKNHAVSCPTPDSCMMSGHYRRLSGSYSASGYMYAPHAAGWDGSSWSLQSPKNPGQEEEPNGSTAYFDGIECTSSSTCVAVGYREPSSGAIRSHIQRYQAPGPASETFPATSIAIDGATLNASVNPEGASTAYQFEYGSTAEYGSTIPASPASIGDGSEDVEVSKSLEKLDADATYHFRVTATNNQGTTYGEDRTFTTLPLPPKFSSAFGEYGTGEGQLNEPLGIAIGANDSIWMADSENDRIVQFDRQGNLMVQVGSGGTGNGQFNKPYALDADSEGNVWVADTLNSRIQKFNSKGEYLSQLGTQGDGNGQFFRPYGLTVDAEDNLWVADTLNSRIQKFNSKGEYLSQFETESRGVDIAVDPDENVWVVEDVGNRVRKFDPAGEELAQIGGTEGSGEGEFHLPTGLGVDSEGKVWIADSMNNRIQVFDSSGGYLTQFGEEGSDDGQLDFPRDVAFDSEGYVWIADSYNSRVQLWTYPRLPTASSEAATAIRTTEATLQGKVNPKGSVTSYWFEYGPTSSYGSKLPVSAKAIGSGVTSSLVSQTVAGLSPDTTTHYRVVAESEAGIAYGDDRYFTTPTHEWTHDRPLEEAAEVSFSGLPEFSTVLGDLICEANGTATLEPGGTGTLDELELAPESCTGTEYLEGCEMEENEAQSLPWDLQAGAEAIEAEGVEVYLGLANCPLSEITLEFETLTLTPDDVTAIGSLALSGEGTMHTLGQELEIEAGGELEADPPGAFGIDLGEWTHDGPLEEAAEVSFSGLPEFSTVLGDLICEANGTATLEPGGTGTLDELELAPESCTGTEYLEGCEMEENEAQSLPWDLQAGAEAIEAEGVEVYLGLANCPLSEITLEFETLTLTPDDVTAIGSLALSGEGTLHTLGQELGIEAGGELEADPAGAFGIG